MAVISNLNEFIEKIDSLKRANPLDLSSDQDLSIAIMNLISIEEHLFFSGAKTHNNYFYDLIEEVREYRKELLGKIIKSYQGEVWCISKHLLAGCMRLSEVATKSLHSGNKDEAYEFFGKAYNLYCLFWGLNLESIDEKTTRKLAEEIDADTAKNFDRDGRAEISDVALDSPTVKHSSKIMDGNSVDQEKGSKKKNRRGFGTTIRDLISKAVNCCRE